MIEQFTDTNIDGETIIMRIDGDIIRFGGRFEENAKMHLHSLGGEQRAERIIEALDFFRNYASLFSRNQLGRVLKCYRRAANQRSDDTRTAFWRFWDGKRIQNRRHFFTYEESQ